MAEVQTTPEIQALAKQLRRDHKTVAEDIDYLRAVQLDSSLITKLFITDGWLYHDLTRYQLDGWRRFDNLDNRKGYEIWPRGHLKTTLFTRIWATWQAITMRRRYVMIFSDGQANYINNLNAAWSVLTGPKFRSIQWLYAYFHGLEPPRKVGNIIYLPGGSKIEFRSIDSESRGANDEAAGGRPDLILFDDVTSTDAASSHVKRETQENRIISMILPMGADDAVFRGAGTLIHREDYVAKVARGIFGGWTVTPAQDQEAHNDDYSFILFPEKFTEAEFRRIQSEDYDSVGKGWRYRIEYRNDIRLSKDQPLGIYDCPVAQPDTLTHDLLIVDHSQCVGQDYYAVTGLRRDTLGKTYAKVYTRRNDLTVPERLTAVYDAIMLRRPERVIVEDTSESRTFIDILLPFLQSKGVSISVDTPTAASRGDKVSFILGWVEPLCKAGSLLCEDQQTRDILSSEMNAFSVSSTANVDDVLDTIAGGARYLRTPAAPKKVLFAPTGIPQLDRERKRLRDSLTGKKTEAVSFL